MKKIITNEVTDTAQLPGIVKIVDHIQQSYTEVVNAIMAGLVSYTANDVVILYGCVFSGTDPGARSMTAGAVFYNGEVYLVDAVASFTTTGSQIPVWRLVETYPSGTILFTDGTSHNVFAVRKFVVQAGPVGGSGVSGYVTDYNSSNIKYSPFGSPLGEVKMFAGSISGVFDATGLGSGIWRGWALCNGQNSTVDLRGRFIAGLTNSDGTNYVYTNSEKNVSDYNAVGKIGGEQKHTLLSAESGLRDHVHNTWSNDAATSYDSGTSGNSSPTVSDLNSGPVLNVDLVSGRDGAQDALVAHENRPPFYVLAFVQKIAA